MNGNQKNKTVDHNSLAVPAAECSKASTFLIFQELCSILGEDSLLVEETTGTEVSNDNDLSD